MDVGDKCVRDKCVLGTCGCWGLVGVGGECVLETIVCQERVCVNDKCVSGTRECSVGDLNSVGQVCQVLIFLLISNLKFSRILLLSRLQQILLSDDSPQIRSLIF